MLRLLHEDTSESDSARVDSECNNHHIFELQHVIDIVSRGCLRPNECRARLSQSQMHRREMFCHLQKSFSKTFHTFNFSPPTIPSIHVFQPVLNTRYVSTSTMQRSSRADDLRLANELCASIKCICCLVSSAVLEDF